MTGTSRLLACAIACLALAPASVAGALDTERLGDLAETVLTPSLGFSADLRADANATIRLEGLEHLKDADLLGFRTLAADYLTCEMEKAALAHERFADPIRYLLAVQVTGGNRSMELEYALVPPGTSQVSDDRGSHHGERLLRFQNATVPPASEYARIAITDARLRRASAGGSHVTLMLRNRFNGSQGSQGYKTAWVLSQVIGGRSWIIASGLDDVQGSQPGRPDQPLFDLMTEPPPRVLPDDVTAHLDAMVARSGGRLTRDAALRSLLAPTDELRDGDGD